MGLNVRLRTSSMQQVRDAMMDDAHRRCRTSALVLFLIVVRGAFVLSVLMSCGLACGFFLFLFLLGAVEAGEAVLVE